MTMNKGLIKPNDHSFKKKKKKFKFYKLKCLSCSVLLCMFMTD